MTDDQLVALVSVLLALVLAVMRLRGELAARRERSEQSKTQTPPSNDFERWR